MKKIFIKDEAVIKKIIDLYQQGYTLQAVKLLKENSELDLKESKALIDLIRSGSISIMSAFYSDPNESGNVLDDVLGKISCSECFAIKLEEAYFSKNKIKFIKIIKDITSWTLRESKVFADKLFPLLKQQIVDFEQIFEHLPVMDFEFPVHCKIDKSIGFVQKTNDEKLRFFYMDYLLNVAHRDIKLIELSTALIL